MTRGICHYPRMRGICHCCDGRALSFEPLDDYQGCRINPGACSRETDTMGLLVVTRIQIPVNLEFLRPISEPSILRMQAKEKHTTLDGCSLPIAVIGIS